MFVGGVLACSAAPGPTDAPSATPAAAPVESPAAPAPASGALPSDGQVQQILDARVGEFADQYGIVVGLIDAGGKRVVSRGRFSKESPRALDGETLFELGSITKVFTALLLAIAVERGEVGLDDPVEKHLPPGTKVPSLNARPITLRDLATHTSSLPRGPKNLVSEDVDDPYAGYTVEMLYAYLATLELEREPGSSYQYSNLGAALLARALMVRTGKSYAELVRERISEPLGLRNTWVDVPAERRAWLAPGHTAMLRPAPYRTRDAMIGNGGVFSSADDLLTFLSASMGLVETPLASAFATIAAPQKPIDDHGGSIGLGWHLSKQNAQDLVWHNGGTAGFSTCAAYDRRQRQGVVVLSNVNTEGGVDDIALHLVAAGPLEPVGSPRVTPTLPHAIDPQRLDRYVGEYEMGPGKIVNVLRDGDQLSFQLPGKRKLALHPLSEKVFRIAQIGMEFSFETDESGQAVAVVMSHDGKSARMPRRGASARGPSSRVEPASPH
jgi:D-alanyl-D-alanine-carboxypeptidase/D-alanyl-D-alanine-endopeptidase